jgi:hypothetical protein
VGCLITLGVDSFIRVYELNLRNRLCVHVSLILLLTLWRCVGSLSEYAPRRSRSSGLSTLSKKKVN